MKARLVVFAVLGVSLLVYHVVTNDDLRPQVPTLGRVLPGEPPHEVVEIRKQLVREQKIGGEEPPEPVDLTVRVWTDPTDGKNRLYYEISEAHGYYVDTFRLQFWFAGGEGITGPRSSPLVVPVFLNDYLTAGDVLRSCVDVTPIELRGVGGSLGSSEDWAARVVSYYRARAANPDPLPEAPVGIRCD